MTRPKPPLAPQTRRVTAQTVADLAGVSRSAVSRAFTPGAYLDAEKRRDVLRIAAEIGYQPNALAAGLKGGSAHLIAIFVGNMRNPYDTAFVSQLVSALNDLNKWPLLIDGSGDRALTAMDEVLRYPLDALILRGGSMPAEVVSQCARFGIPMISSGRPVHSAGVDNVCCRNLEGAQMGAQLLLDKGRTRFGLIGGAPGLYSTDERRAGVMAALTAASVPLIAEAPGDYTVEGGQRAAAGLLAAHDLDALICANDAMAIGALSAAADLGRAVPRDLSVIGFDDIAMAHWPIINLTTLRNPIDSAVAQIIALLERRLADHGKADETIMLTPELVLRGSH
ncbi:MAG: LacI family DNA-binding transcriptional regulator [Sulfitobacter sp.]